MPAHAAASSLSSDRRPLWRLTCDLSNSLCVTFKRRPNFSSRGEPGSAWSLLSVALPLDVVFFFPSSLSHNTPLYPCPITCMTTKASTAAYLTLMTDDSDTPFPPLSFSFTFCQFIVGFSSDGVSEGTRQAGKGTPRSVDFFGYSFRDFGTV
ncbi:uncharacterized protein J3D65DRAFT_216859 [Phyllosticta citribraziliensis]|uniref:Uncharacterized protein n=1 Tax=Phyllosticta citribraziliensis TaxID=989973 RepID=A0ABR1M4E2_9PEZI